MPIVRGQTRTRKLFDWLAPSYDLFNRIIFRPEWRVMVAESFLAGRVLDVGVGTGFTTRDLVGAVGIDISREMISRARDYRGDLVLADAMAPPFRPGSFSTIACAGSFYYLPDPATALRGFFRLLADGGRVVLLSPEAWFLRPIVHVFRRREYEDLAREAGFVLRRCETLRGVACLVVMEKRGGSRGELTPSERARGRDVGAADRPRSPPA